MSTLEATNNKRTISYPKSLGTLLVCLYIIYCVSNPTLGHLIDSVDLVIHEAGHFIFMFFGEFMHVLGGSLNQVLIPLIFAGYFYMKRDWYSASVVLMWVGYSVTNVAIYMSDAISMQLPLLGGDGVIHDWNWLLGNSGLLLYTNTLGRVTYGIGLTIIVIGIIQSLYFSYEKR